jgi:hypothetical protein
MSIGQIVMMWIGAVLFVASIWCAFTHSGEINSDND